MRVLVPIGKTNPHARTLRATSTEAERLLWRALRNRQLGNRKFRRQVTIGPYVADFVCTETMLVVEVDGGQHNEELDAKRTAFLQQRGFTVSRFWNNEVLENLEGVLGTILVAARGGKAEERPSPCPLPRAGEES